jgi:serine/threonine protein kinase/WD40 repeat protein
VRVPDADTSLLAQLRELSEEERAALLRQAFANDSAAPGGGVPRSTSVVGQVAAAWFEAALQFAPPENSGAKIGPYKLLQKLGEGGFGVVWMAEQTEPIKRHVALKIIKVGMDTEEVIARFEAERQALALMEHPNIAYVFDAGATDSGRPYFVMELVRGVAITRYCDENRLSAEARLRLFITVCQAVQHAHQKGVIHRDLKPSNILVTLHDGVPVPKIIDFGIAKATSARLTEKTLFTQFNAFIGTPAYTSPEQMEMSGLDVDTRSDIYSLGVLLYELLTGQPPFDSNALVKSGLEAMRRTVREVDPPRPSHCLGTLSDVERTSVAEHRGTDATKLSLLLRGDLDWIAMRCLEKDRTRRYASATGLAADIERHLSDDLVEARPPSQFYRIKKFVRRHKVGVAAVTAVAVSLIGGLIVSSTLFVSERAAREHATAAEKTQGELRRQAEVARANEQKRAARTALDLANRNLADGHFADGLAYLVYASRKDPSNTTLGPRLASALATHNFLLPEGPGFECGSPILAVHFTKDGRSIYVGTEDGVLRIFDAASGFLQREIRIGRPILIGGWEFPKANDSLFTVRFPDRTFGVYDIHSGQPRWPLLAFEPEVWQDGASVNRGQGVGISPDGRWLCALGLRQFWIWDAATGNTVLQQTFPEHRAVVGGFDFTADGAQFAVTVGTSVHRWSLPHGVPLATIEGGVPARPILDSRGILRTVKFSPNGRAIAVAGRNTPVRVFDATTGNELHSLRVGGDLEHPSLVFASDARIFASTRLRSGSWDLTTGEFMPLPIARGADLLSGSFNASGSVVLVTAADGSVTLCDLVAGKLTAEPLGRQDRACAALAPDGMHVITGNATGTLQRFRVGGGSSRPLELRSNSPMAVTFLAESPARVLLMQSTHARVLDVISGRETAGGFAFPAPILEPGWARGNSPIRSDAKFAMVPTSEGWQAWEIGPGQVVHVASLEGAPGAGSPRGTPVAFSARGDLVAIFRNFQELGVWNLRTGALAGPKFTTPNYIRSETPRFSPDGSRLAFGTPDGASMVIDVATGVSTASFATRALVPVYGVAFSEDGRRVVTLNDRNETCIWNAATGELIASTRDAADTKLRALSRYSPDGQWFATIGDHGVRLWDGTTGAPAGNTISVWDNPACSFSRDSRSLGTADGNGEVRVWEVPGGQPLTEPMRNDVGRMQFSQFSPDGRFVCAAWGQRFCLWSVPPRLTEGTPVPEWLLSLATSLNSKKVNEAGELIDGLPPTTEFLNVCRQIAALPVDAPLAEWGRWILEDRPDRSIAPGFTVTRAEAAKLALASGDDVALEL